MTPRASSPEIRITPPRVIPDFAKRRQLLDGLDTTGHRLVYVVAPPGFGKSVLASQWVERAIERDGAAVWIEIDPFESEFEFMSTAVLAFRREIEEFAIWFDPSRVTTLDGSLEALDRMIDELSKFKREIRLVVDSADHFGVSSSAIANRFISKIPHNVMIMVVRERSPITSSLGTIGMNDFTVITAEDLKLGVDEITEMMGNPDRHLAEQIIELTNGWPAATRIVLENLRQNDFKLEREQLTGIGSLASITRQAIARIDEREMLVLRSLVFVDRISNNVAMAITGDDLSPMILAKLSAESFFLTRVISTPTVYEMNQLIRDALIEDLALDLDSYSELHSRSFNALFNHGAKEQAFNLLAKSGNEEMIKRFIGDNEVMAEVNQSIRDAIYRGDINNLRSWVNLLPFLDGKRRSLSFALSFYLQLLSGRLEEAKALLVERASAPLSDEESVQVKLASRRLQAIVDFLLGDFQSSKACTLEALAAIQSEDDHESSRLSSFSSFLRFGATSALFAEDIEAMRRIEEFIDTTLKPDPSSHYHMNALSIKTVRAYYEGRYRLAESFAYAAISYASQHNIRGFFTPFEAYFVLFQTLVEQGKFDEAEGFYRTALDEAIRVKNVPWIAMLKGRHVIALMRRGATQRGLEEFHELIEQLPAVRSPQIDLINDKHEMILQHSLDSEVRTEKIRSRLPANQTARLFKAQTHLRKNSKEFEKSIAEFDLSLPREAINAYVFLVIQNFEYPPKAREYLIKALGVAQEHGYYQYLLIQGDRFLSFLISASTEIPSLFLERLAKDASERLSTKMTSSDSLPVPLTKREADILRHLSTEQPLSKIAGNLNITKNTMKTHLRHLYRKLGATDRRDAVEKGKALLSL